MPTVKFKMGRRNAWMTYGLDWKPGDLPPKDGYNDWFDWAEVQHKAKLRQVYCGLCGLSRYPQELGERRIESTVYRDKAMTKPVQHVAAVCLKCEGKQWFHSGGS